MAGTSVASSQYDNPFDDDSDWSRITLAGQGSPGVIPPDGVEGFSRKTGWDIKKGKGAQGATLTVTTLPPAEGSFTFHLWNRTEYIQWISFQKLLKYNPHKTVKTSADALDIYFPSLANLDITKVVTQDISPIRHVGGKLYVVKVEFIEWQNPPPASIVATTTTSKDASGAPGDPPDPISDALQNQIVEAWGRAGLNPGDLPGVSGPPRPPR